MQKQSNLYSFMFAFIVCAVCSLLLAAVSEGLKSLQQPNVAGEVKKNILKAVRLEEPLTKSTSSEEIGLIFSSKIESVVIDDKGDIVRGKAQADIKPEEKNYPLFVYKEKGKVLGYCFPVQGPGLWEDMYGYLAIDADGVTVRGITFYKHGETPGLGAEIETEWFQKNFEGKRIWDEATQQLVGIAVAVGKVKDKIEKAKWDHYVDGISGSTLTGDGVTALIKKSLDIYEPFFLNIRKK